MATTMDFDTDLATRIEAIYATPDIHATRVAVFRNGAPRKGERVLDIGCGPGYLTRDMALAVGTTGQVTAIDISDPMLGLAQRRCADLKQARFEKADVGTLPARDHEIDLACALQVYCYVKDLDDALAELRRVVKPGGRAVILDTDYSGVVWETRDRARMKRILDVWDAHAAWPDLPRILPRKLREAGFKNLKCEVVPILTTAYHPNTYVHGMSRLIHAFVTRNGCPQDDADSWLAEFDTLEAEGAFLFCMNRFMFVAS